MATINNAHHESGGVVLFQGELILLFCENVNLSIVEKNESETGKLYLTTHRMIFTNQQIKNNLKSLSIPFYTMHDLSLEQPIFGANYIKGKCTEASQQQSKLTFKLKFKSGGATEYGQALLNAAKAVRTATQAPGFQPPPAYNPNPAASFYQAPPNVYQPAYNCGFALPNDIFNQPPPAGFIYTMEAPPPYPGLGPNNQNPANKPGYPAPPQQAPTGYPSQPAFAPTGNPQGPPPGAGFGFGPQPGYGGGQPGFAPPPQQPAYAPTPQQPGYAPRPPQQPGFAPPAYPAAQPNGYPAPQNEQRQQQPSMYPNLNDIASAPSAPPM